MHAQLTIFDALEAVEAENELRRLGDEPEFGQVLLMPLLASGWELHRAMPFAGGDRVLFILTNGVFEVKREGRTLADVAVELFKEAAPLASAASDVAAVSA